VKRFLQRALCCAAVGLSLTMIPTVCAPAQNECGGVRGGPLPDRLRRIASLNWREVDRATIAKEWPEANLCPPGTPSPLAPSLEEIAVGIDQCCDKYSACVALNFTAPAPGARGFWGFDLYLRRSSKQVAFDALAELVAAVVPERPKAKELEDWGPSDRVDRSRYMALWTTAEDTFVLDASVEGYSRDSKGWYGHLALHRRWLPAVRETWTLDDGSLVRILSIETTGRSDSREKVLRVRYLTDCLVDSPCLERESGHLWPRLRSLAEKQGAQEVSLLADDCALYSAGFAAKRGADGKWSGNLPAFFGMGGRRP
jgi:hypothetical protein